MSAGSGAEEEPSSLKARRDELAAQVAELHWDLGGLAYEMAIRDHFRLDVLVRRAAALQERDAELAELERLLEAQAGVAERSGAQGRLLPGPGVATLLLLVMLGFGVLAGSLANSSSTAAGTPGGRLTLKLRSAQADSSVVAAPALEPTTPPPSALGALGSSAVASPSSSSEPASGPSQRTADPSQPASGVSGETGTSAGGHAKTTAPGSGPAKLAPAPTPSKSGLPPVKHVFLIVLADQPYSATFGPSSPAPYLASTLARRGELLVRYYAVARDELANEIALVSGLGPTADTAANCPTFLDVTPAIAGRDGQYSGDGCVYPSAVQTVGDQLAAKKLSWRVYAEDMEHGPAGQPRACRHPAFGAADTTSVARVGDAFATYRDPFTYFDSAIDGHDCAREDVGLSALRGDLADAKVTPALSYIVPNLCHDGREASCTPGAPAGLPAAEGFLRRVVPEILHSPAYKQGGLLVITTDQAPATGAGADSSSCCAQPDFPGVPGNQPTPSASAVGKLPPPGGGQVGALLLSPYVKPHSFDQEPFNHFSLLRMIEDLFGLSHLGYAGRAGVGSFDQSVFPRYRPG